MTWAEHHKTSSVLAESARGLAESGEMEAARARFAQAAEAEERALAFVDPQTEPRTFGASSVGATALWYKAGEFGRARDVAQRALQVPTLAQFARRQLDELLDDMSPREHAGSARRRSLGVGIAAAVIALCTVGLLWWLPSANAPVYATQVGEVRTVTLEEGTVAVLNTRTDLRRVDPDNARKVRLVAGEALFDVRHDAAHPFVVELDHSEIRVLGTRFNVYRRSERDVQVTVVEGTVEISGMGSGGTWTRRVSAGEQIEYAAAGPLAEPRAADTESVASWRSHEIRLPSEGMRLQQIVDELMRYTDKRIEIRDPRAAKLAFGGAGIVLPTNDVPAALDRLKSLGIITWTERNGEYVIELSPGAANRRVSRRGALKA